MTRPTTEETPTADRTRRAYGVRGLLVLVGLAAACDRQPPNRQAIVDTPVRVLAGPPGPAAPAPAPAPVPSDSLAVLVASIRAAMPSDSAPPTPVSAEARAACDAAAAVWSSVPGAAVQRSDTVTQPGDVIGDSTIAHWTDRRSGPRVAACRVEGNLEKRADEATLARLSWERAGSPRRNEGWAAVWGMEASGPESATWHYQRGRVRCRVSQQWDESDDPDSTYVPSPFYNESILCWQHWRDLAPVDTATRPG